MNLKPKKKKIIFSLVIGFIIGLIFLILTLLGYNISYSYDFLIFLIISALVYFIWCLFEPEFSSED